jgi:hypothetical protein
MTDKEKRLRVTLATAMDGVVDANARLRAALVGGDPTESIRDEIAALNRRAADAGREIAEIGTRREIARSAKLAEQSASIIAAVNARFGGRLGALQPPPKPEPFLALETTI